MAMLLVSAPSWANSGGTDNEEPGDKTSKSKKESLAKAFFDDIEEKLLFIDFQMIPEDILAVNVFRAGKLMMEDRVGDLPGHTIYELNLEVFREGTYDIELVTEGGIKIVKEIKVK